MNLEKVKEKLAQLKGNGAAAKSIWKPAAGKTVVRLLPYKHDPEWPFIELAFHYDFGSTILSPSVFGNPDPVNEFADLLRESREPDDYALSRKLRAKERYYVPLLIRGEEKEGVKFWGFSKTIYETILGFMDEDYGDLTDLKNGRDVTIEFTPAQGSGYPETKIIPKANTSVATTDKDVLNLIKEMPDIKTLFKTASYNELKAMMEKYLNPPAVEGESQDSYVEDGDIPSTDLPEEFSDLDLSGKADKKAAKEPEKELKSVSIDDLDALLADI